MEVSFKQRSQVRAFAAEHGEAKLEEELDSGRLDLRSVLLVEQWLDDAPLRARNRRRKRLRQVWNVFVFAVCILGAAAIFFLFWMMVR